MITPISPLLASVAALAALGQPQGDPLNFFRSTHPPRADDAERKAKRKQQRASRKRNRR